MARKKVEEFHRKNKIAELDIQETFGTRSFKASLSQTQKTKIKVEYYHTGVWERVVDRSASKDS